MIRRRFPILTAVSFVLLVLVVSLWVQSYVAPHYVIMGPSREERTEVYARSMQGAMYMAVQSSFARGGHAPVVLYESVPQPPEPDWGMTVQRWKPVRLMRTTTRFYSTQLIVAYWLPAVLLSVLPLRWLWRRSRHRGGAGFPVEPSAPSSASPPSASSPSFPSSPSPPSRPT